MEAVSERPQLAEPLVAAVLEVCERVRPLVSWAEFGRVPSAPAAATWKSRLENFVHTVALERYSYLQASPFQALALRRLERRRGRRAVTLFRFLCLGDAVCALELAGVFAPRELDDWRSAGLLLDRGDQLALAVRLIPYRDYCYVTQGVGTGDGEAPYLGDQTHTHIELSKRFLRRRPCRRLLDMGCGIGMAALELQSWAAERVGSELSFTSLEYARLNQQLRGDAAVVFLQSNLFANVSGCFDLISFNPWQPSEAALPLILRFVREAPRFLAPGGTVQLAVDTLLAKGRDTVLEAVQAALREQGLSARRQIFTSYRAMRDERGVGVAAGSMLWITQKQNRPTWRTLPGVEALKFAAKYRLISA